jgi:hypothetical protein
MVDRGELTPVEEKTGAERIHGIVRDAADRWRLRGLSGGGTGLDERREDEGGREGQDPPTTDGRALWPSHAISLVQRKRLSRGSQEEHDRFAPKW